MKIKLVVNPESVMPYPYGNNLGSHEPSDEEIRAAFEKGEFDARVMDEKPVQDAIDLEALKASNGGANAEAYCAVWRTYHAKRTAYWMQQMKLKPDSWQKDEGHPLTVRLLAIAGNHRARAAKLLKLSPIEVIVECDIESVCDVGTEREEPRRIDEHDVE